MKKSLYILVLFCSFSCSSTKQIVDMPAPTEPVLQSESIEQIITDYEDGGNPAKEKLIANF